MIGSGQTLYHFTYIDDLVEGIILAGTRDAALGEVFTIAGGEYISLRQLVDTIADVLGKARPRLRVPFYPVLLAAKACDWICRPLGISPPLYPRRVEFFVKDRAFRIEKAQRLLGYRPRVGLAEGLRRTADWYREKGYLA
jgi:nucleoside-diphosphate-sugar epimerase